MGCGASKKQENGVAESGKSSDTNTNATTFFPKTWQELSENTTATTVDLREIPADEFKLLYPKAGPLKLGQQVQKLIVAPLPEGMTHIGSDFLENSSEVTSIDLSQVTSTKNLGKNFLKGCSNLQSITPFNMPNLNTVGANLFQECEKLTILDFSTPCPNLTKIDKNFGEKLISLETINLAGWTGVVEIESNFLNSATALTSIDLSPLTALQKIGSDFMSECKKLSNIGMKNLTAVSKVGKRFLFIPRQEEGPAVNREILIESTPSTSVILIDAARDVSGVKIQEVADGSEEKKAEENSSPSADAVTKESNGVTSNEKEDEAPTSNGGPADEADPTKEAGDMKKEEPPKEGEDQKEPAEGNANGGNAAPQQDPASPVGIFKTVTSSRDLKAVGPEAN